MNRLLGLLALACACAAVASAAAGARTQQGARVESIFPAAGQFLIAKVPVRATPSPHGRVIKMMHQFRDDYRIQEILALKTDDRHRRQALVQDQHPDAPERDDGLDSRAHACRSPRPSARSSSIASSRTIDLYWHGKHVWHAIVAIGAPGMETPLGHYYVAARFVPYDDPFLGVFAVETSAYSKLTEWPGGGCRRHPRDEHAAAARAGGLARLRPRVEPTAAALRQLAPLGTPIVITG